MAQTFYTQAKIQGYVYTKIIQPGTDIRSLHQTFDSRLHDIRLVNCNY